ncbi:MAG: efflux RND transporter periplasmic adaptor subunit [Lentisphaeria bacterium]
MTCHRFIRLPVLLAAGLLFAAGCGKKDGAPPARPPTPVHIVAAATATVPTLLPAFGTAVANVQVNITPQVSGKILKALIKDGETVAADQPLFEIDPSDYANTVHQSEGAVEGDRANLWIAKLNVDRNQPLVAKNLISQNAFDNYKATAEAAEAKLKADLASLEQAKLDLTRCTVRAPSAGVCSKVMVNPGNLAVANQTVLTTLKGLDPIQAEFALSEEYLPALRRELAAGPVTVSVQPRGDDQSYAGRVVFIDNAVNTATGTILVRAEIPNPEHKLWPNQFLAVTVRAGEFKDAVVIPESAVQTGKMGPFAFVVDAQNTAELRPVQLGVRTDGHVHIKAGIKAGERVVAQGLFMLVPGATVMEMPPPGGAPGHPGAPAGKPAAVPGGKP